MLRIFEADVFWVIDCCGDHVSAAGPFTEIYKATTFAAERELGIGAQDQFLAGGIRRLKRRLRGIAQLENSSYQVVIVCFGNLEAVKLANLNVAAAYIVVFALVLTFVHLLGVRDYRAELPAIELFLMLLGLLFVGPGKYSVDKS